MFASVNDFKLLRHVWLTLTVKSLAHNWHTCKDPAMPKLEVRPISIGRGVRRWAFTLDGIFVDFEADEEAEIYTYGSPEEAYAAAFRFLGKDAAFINAAQVLGSPNTQRKETTNGDPQ